MARFQALLFDIDDTLYPEVDYVLSGFRAVARWCQDEFGYPVETTYQQLARSYAGKIHEDPFAHWFEEHEIDPVLYKQRAIDVYRKHVPSIACFPGAPDMLARLRSVVRLGIVSDGRLDVQQRKVVALGIAGLFDTIVFSDQWGREYWKPHPRAFETALAALNVRGCDAVYVADNPAKDFIGAKTLGLWTVQLSFPNAVYAGTHPPSLRHAPDATIQSILEVESLLS